MIHFFFGNTMSRLGRHMAKGSIILGLVLVGFGMLVFVLQDVFAFLAAGLLYVLGFFAILDGLAALLTGGRQMQPYRHGPMHPPHRPGRGAGGIIWGLMLIGFGLLAYVGRGFFAFIAAAFFFYVGFSSIVYGVRMWLMLRRRDKEQGDRPEDAYRENVRIHTGHVEEE